MAYIIVTLNPFEPSRVEKHETPGGISIRQWLVNRDSNFTEFPTPTLIKVNGVARLRKEWDMPLQPQDIVNIIPLPGDPLTVLSVISVVVTVALSVAFALTVQVPTTPGEQPASDPVFSIKGQTNDIRLGEPIECPYGRNRIYPSLAARPWYMYIDNEHYQYSIFCIGQGEYDISAIQIGDTLAEDFQEVTYEIIPPGGNVTIFPAQVYTALEAGGQTIYAPNEEEYIAPGWVGPFPTNPPGTDINTIQVDLIFPKGIYRIEDDGDLSGISVTVEIQYQEIDDAGNALGAWVPLTSPDPYVFTGSTTTPQRRTLSVSALAEGRYHVQMRRPVDKTLSHKVGNDLVWEALKGLNYNTVQEPWGDVTLLAVKIRASSNLNERTQLRFNVIATRKLPIWDGSTWSAPTATRSIIWAFADVFKSLYGGRVEDTFLDLETMLALDTLFTSRSDYFDWIFRDPITVWEAARTIARVGRATPLLVGSLITLRRDSASSVPVTLFTPDNIIGNFTWAVRMWEINDYDGIRVEYTDATTGYKQEQVTTTYGRPAADNPEDIRIPGIQDRAHAYREAIYIQASRIHLRENISWDTGLEGYIPMFGDLVAIAHDAPNWGQSGYIVAAEHLTGDDYTIYLSEALDWSAIGSKVMMLRSSTSEMLGPYTVVESDNSMKAVITITGAGGAFDFLLGGDTEPMLFIFGVSGSETKYVKVVRIEPQGGEVIHITAVNYASEIHDHDAEVPDDLPAQPELPEEAEVAAPSALYLGQIDGPMTPIVQAMWSPVQGALRYNVQTSVDGVNWTDKGEFSETYALLEMLPGSQSVRVSAITNQGRGPWIDESIVVADLLGLVLLEEWDGLQWAVGWTNIFQAVDWKILVYDNSQSAPILKQTYYRSFERRFVYGYFENALADDNVVREHLVKVIPVYHSGEGTEVSMELSNPIPSAPTGMASNYEGDESTGALYTLSWEVPLDADLIEVRVWLSDTDAFDPAVATPVVVETAALPGYDNVITSAEVVVPFSSGTAHAIHYWRVGVFDVWGQEIFTNISAQQTIAARV